MGLLTLLYVYIFGGITFVPVVLLVFVYLHPILQSTDPDHDEKPAKEADEVGSEYLKAGEIEETSSSGLDAYKAGWIIVTQEYLDSPDDISSTTQTISESNENKSAYSSLYKLVQKDSANNTNNNNSSSTNNTIAGGGLSRSRSTSFDSLSNNISSTLLGMTNMNTNGIASETNSVFAPSSSAVSATTLQQPSSNNSILEPAATSPSLSSNFQQPPVIQSPSADKVKSSQKKHRYYAILKHGNLFLYKDETLKDVKHVIVLSSYFISMWPRDLPDGQLFTKSSAIAMVKSSKLNTLTSREESAPKGSFFLYTDINADKEDWYFTLVRATKLTTNSDLHEVIDPQVYAKTLHFQTKHMIDLIQTLYSSEGQLQTKWFNALIGRLFLSLQGTKTLENYLHTKIAKKLNKIKTPGFLDKFSIKSIYPGDSAPFLTYPSLKEISPDGTVLVSVYLTYHGNLSLQIATKVNINLGARFKTREVDLLLNITLSKLEGPILIKIKPPPSERLWYTFETEPIMNLKIEPIISSRQMTYNIITNSIEKKFKEAIKDSLVLPHWDDIVFYDTMDEIYRGGIWDPSARPGNDMADSDLQTLNSANSNDYERETFSDLDTKSELTFRSLNKSKLSNTLTDLSKRIKKKTSSASTLIADSQSIKSETQSVLTPSTNNKNSATMNTLKKIGKWYFKDEKAAQEEPEPYKPPEMISNRRVPRKNSNPDLPKPTIPLEPPLTHMPSYEFGKYDDILEPPSKPLSRKVSLTGLDNVTVPRTPPPLPPREDELITEKLDLSANTNMDPSKISNNPFVSPVRGSAVPSSQRSATVATTLANSTSHSTHGLEHQHSLHRRPPPPGPPPKLPSRQVPLEKTPSRGSSNNTFEAESGKLEAGFSKF
ncbi:putative integral membrane protein conserved region-domain-containing protein [Scheffersomyces xylosifermentans]|uniref:putative integral membrane protein conserved region-domain-containing protein n=1 Tax=Scheffersomyces xylosifermentans TaxID=1304137 RepID=UPI00315C5E62